MPKQLNDQNENMPINCQCVFWAYIPAVDCSERTYYFFSTAGDKQNLRIYHYEKVGSRLKFEGAKSGFQESFSR